MMATIEEINHTKALVRRGILHATQAFMDEPAALLAEICNGCSTAAAKFDFVPDTIWGLCICDACFIHDWEYSVGTTKYDKDRADDGFLINGINIIEANSNWLMKILRRRRMLKYYEAVTEFGEDAYWADKEVPRGTNP